MILEPIERPLTPGERASLTTRIASAAAERRLALVKTGAASAAVCAVLAALTVAASDAPAMVILGFWLAMAAVFTVWIGWPWRKLMHGQVVTLEDARRADKARVIRVQSSRVIEFEEEEDEGACYAFELGPAASVFVVGQEFYEDEQFPNADFSIVEILGTSGHPVDSVVITNGQKLSPVRVVPVAVKQTLDIPDHLSVVTTPLEGLEAALGRSAT